MPKREDLKTILIIGSGPIVIGRACEFDYSGTQAAFTARDAKDAGAAGNEKRREIGCRSTSS